ncbi:hypothetical protein DL546_006845 [Coniochaeta pulveracea]|uniref:Sister chromatid cohesion protein DCC1 n=1 Tax=Coniochaeta pulveracea TaxID=177199 RepID=A0A420YH02_9PEZI|nr:hypothetical protein DL546_006845 [Coniochaeta pulveracea]
MSTQDNQGIPLAHAPDGVSYKLLELPPELVALLESDTPPVLTLKPSSTAALLKTADKTYSLRQKNTSNALILLSPSGQACPATESDLANAAEGLKAIATVHDTVELVAETENARAPATTTRGKWHEKFGRSR